MQGKLRQGQVRSQSTRLIDRHVSTPNLSHSHAWHGVCSGPEPSPANGSAAHAEPLKWCSPRCRVSGGGAGGGARLPLH